LVQRQIGYKYLIINTLNTGTISESSLPKQSAMEKGSILRLLGYGSQKPGSNQATEQLLYYSNPDGSIRWIWPAGLSKPLFLKFYHQAGWRARAFALVVRIIFLVRLQRYAFKSIEAVRLKTSTEEFSSGEWSAFTGTPGPNRKVLVYESSNGRTWFHKIPVGENAAHLLRNEKAALKRVQSMTDRTFQVPAVGTDQGAHIRLTDIGAKTKSIGHFGSSHHSILQEIRHQTQGYAFLHSLPIWEETEKRLSRLERQPDFRIPPALLRKLRMLIDRFDKNLLVETSLAHGDFTPWNMYQRKDNSLAVFDWELSRPAMPFGFDAFHFIIQNGILTQRSTWRELERKINKTLFEKDGLMGSYQATQQRNHLTLYLIINTTYYLTVYAQQPAWHRQVYWLLNTWTMALSSVAGHLISHRKLLLMDLADYLFPKPYAALKYDLKYPENLSEQSDLDLCMPKSVYREVSRFLHDHPLVSRRHRTVQSFMANELIALSDGGLLSVDNIWKFRRRNLIMMPLAPVIHNASLNVSGIRTASPEETAKFVGLFYALNHADIPDKYEHLRTSLSSTTSLNKNLQRYFQKEVDSSVIVSEVRSLQINSGIKSLFNYLAFGLDVIRRILSRPAPVITFSGVDGAGKSTIIENLRLRIEKQLRKPVVVLRHRPSLLPILSAFTKGKAAAERDAAHTLPRQGTNTSLLSSLVRFSYYYFDYLVGQWYVWFMYSLRGRVVLYDRYYFDFIHDSRRSNIDLPSALVRWFYTFIRKPDLNIFLFASPEIIRARKQELDTITIKELTEQYRSFFLRLGKQHHDQYITIENNDMVATLNTIMERVTPLAA